LTTFKTFFFPKITSQWRHTYAQHTSKDALLSSESVYSIDSIPSLTL